MVEVVDGRQVGFAERLDVLGDVLARDLAVLVDRELHRAATVGTSIDSSRESPSPMALTSPDISTSMASRPPFILAIWPSRTSRIVSVSSWLRAISMSNSTAPASISWPSIVAETSSSPISMDMVLVTMRVWPFVKRG